MNEKMSLVAETIKRGADRYGADICALAGYGLAIGAVVSSAKASPKALKLLEEARAERDRESVKITHERKELGLEGEDAHCTIIPDLTKKEKIQLMWRPYATTIGLTLGSGACLLASRYISIKQLTALGFAYKLTENEFGLYKDKVKNLIGKKEHDSVEDAVAADRILKDPVEDHEIYDTKHGETLFYEHFSGRYFRSDIEFVRKAVNNLNYRLVNGIDAWVSLNDLYYELGMGECGVGNVVGWGVNHPVVVEFSAQLTSKDEPCVVLEYPNSPRPYYDDWVEEEPFY